MVPSLRWGCSLGPKSPEFLEILVVPLSACVIPLRKSLQSLSDLFGDRLSTLLQKKAGKPKIKTCTHARLMKSCNILVANFGTKLQVQLEGLNVLNDLKCLIPSYVISPFTKVVHKCSQHLTYLTPLGSHESGVWHIVKQPEPHATRPATFSPSHCSCPSWPLAALSLWTWKASPRLFGKWPHRRMKNIYTYIHDINKSMKNDGEVPFCIVNLSSQCGPVMLAFVRLIGACNQIVDVKTCLPMRWSGWTPPNLSPRTSESLGCDLSWFDLVWE